MKRIEAIITGVRKRGLILYQYLFNRGARERTSVREIIFHLFSLSMKKVAEQQYRMIGADRKYRYYEIYGYQDIFVYPKTAPEYSFNMIMAEARPQHWHYYEIPETAVAPGDVIVDCGAAEGFFTFKYQHVAGRIFAMEPLPLFIDSLRTLFQLNTSVEILPLAAGDSCIQAFINVGSGQTVLDSSIGTTAANGNAIEVTVVTLDSLFAEKGIKIDYLKADIEGFEEQMIRGALRTIRDSKPKIAVTTYHKGQDYRTLIALIKDVVPEYQYRVKGIDFVSGNPVMLHMWI